MWKSKAKTAKKTVWVLLSIPRHTCYIHVPKMQTQAINLGRILFHSKCMQCSKSSVFLLPPFCTFKSWFTQKGFHRDRLRVRSEVIREMENVYREQSIDLNCTWCWKHTGSGARLESSLKVRSVPTESQVVIGGRAMTEPLTWLAKARRWVEQRPCKVSTVPVLDDVG